MKKSILFPLLMVLPIILVSCGEEENPLPVLTSISPTSKVAHMPSFTLTLDGSKFVQGATVIFNGKEKTATFVSANQLTCQIDPTDIVETTAIMGNQNLYPESLMDANVQVTVKNPAPGGGSSAAVNFLIKSNHSFTTPKAIAELNLYTSIPTDIKVDNNGTIHVTYCDRTDDPTELLYIKSIDGGTTWSAPETLASEKIGSNYYIGSSEMEIDNNGNVHTIWIECDGSIFFIGYKYLNVSTNTWSVLTKVCVLNKNENYRIMGADIVVKNQDVFIFSDTYQYGGRSKSYLYYSPSLGTDFRETQLTFIKELTFIGSEYGGNFPDMKILSDGTILLAYYEYDESMNDDEVYFTKSSDKGTTWSTPVKISPTTDTGWSAFAKLLPDSTGQNINAIWFHNFTTIIAKSSIKEKISEDIQNPILLNKPPIGSLLANSYYPQEDKAVLYFSSSTDGGTTWSFPSIIYNYTYFNAYALLTFEPVIDSAGNLNLIFFDKDSAQISHSYFMRSINNGVTWSSPQELGSNPLGISAFNIAVNTAGDIFSLLNYKTSSSPIRYGVHFCKSTQ